MNTYGKLAITLVIVWVVGWCLIFPSTPLAKWGEKKFGSYENFAVLTAGILTAPLLIEIIVWIWCEA
jgi:hypothetical protein